MRKTVSEKISDIWETLTESERKIAHTIVNNYPLAGLNTISDLASKAHVSAATVTRFVTQLGYASFPAFREALRGELEAQFLSPIDKQRALSETTKPPQGKPGYATLFDEIANNLKSSAQGIQKADFDETVRLLSTRSNSIFLVGGRISGAVASHMATILHSIRPNVHFLEGGSATAMEKIVDMHAKDVLFVLDLRRYQRGTIALARLAHEKGCKVVLVTDEWISPIAKYASIIFPLKAATKSIWDSLAVPLAFCEALVNQIGLSMWAQAERRVEQVEHYYQSGMTFDTPEAETIEDSTPKRDRPKSAAKKGKS